MEQKLMDLAAEYVEVRARAKKNPEHSGFDQSRLDMIGDELESVLKVLRTS